MLFITINIKLIFTVTNIFLLNLKYIIIYLKISEYPPGSRILKKIKFA